MKEQLTIEHLSAYLPYGVKMKRNGFIGELLTIKRPKEDSLVHYCEFQVSCSNWWENVDDPNPYKLCLRHLSDLTKEIDHNGESFVPAEYIPGRYSTHVGEWFYLFKREAVDIDDAPQVVFKKLLEWHFDVFGLIDKGLAIDINTLEK